MQHYPQSPPPFQLFCIAFLKHRLCKLGQNPDVSGHSLNNLYLDVERSVVCMFLCPHVPFPAVVTIFICEAVLFTVLFSNLQYIYNASLSSHQNLPVKCRKAELAACKYPTKIVFQLNGHTEGGTHPQCNQTNGHTYFHKGGDAPTIYPNK